MNKYVSLKDIKVRFNEEQLQEHVDTHNEYVEQATPKKVIRKNYGRAYCPNCNELADIVVNNMQYQWKHCANCGQALDWSDKDE